MKLGGLPLVTVARFSSVQSSLWVDQTHSLDQIVSNSNGPESRSRGLHTCVSTRLECLDITHAMASKPRHLSTGFCRSLTFVMPASSSMSLGPLLFSDHARLLLPASIFGF